MWSAPEVGRVAVVAGASGLVGTCLIRLLLACEVYTRVIALVRRPLGVRARKLAERPARFEDLGLVLADVAAASAAGTDADVFCCLGSTLRSAGSRQAFARVDRDFVYALGSWAARCGARRLLVVSALGASASSRVFYSRVKGEMEAGLRSLPLRSLVIFRPALLDGERTERRSGEQMALCMLRPLSPLLPRTLRPLGADRVAASMLAAALSENPPPVLESSAMQRGFRKGDHGG